MKTITCKQLGDETCTFSAEAETVEELKAKLMAHAKEVHAEKLAKMSPQELAEMDKEIDRLIQDK